MTPRQIRAPGKGKAEEVGRGKSPAPLSCPTDASEYILELPNDVQEIAQAVEYLSARCRETGFNCDRLRLNFRVALSEALANAMLYGNRSDPSKRVRVEACFARRKLSVRVTDEGAGFDPNEVPDPTLPANITLPGGRGIFLIRQLMDHVEFNDTGNSVTMVLLDPPSQARRKASEA